MEMLKDENIHFNKRDGEYEGFVSKILTTSIRHEERLNPFVGFSAYNIPDKVLKLNADLVMKVKSTRAACIRNGDFSVGDFDARPVPQKSFYNHEFLLIIGKNVDVPLESEYELVEKVVFEYEFTITLVRERK